MDFLTKGGEHRRGVILFTGFFLALLLSVVLYLWLHAAMPIGSLLLGDPARTRALADIAQARSTLSDTVPFSEATAALSDTLVSLSGKPTDARTIAQAADRGRQALALASATAQRARLNTLLPGLISDTLKVSGLNLDGVVTPTFDDLRSAIAQPQPDRAALGLLFSRLADEVNRGGNHYFWSTGASRWIELLFWAWFGTLLYILAEIYRHFPDNELRQAFKEFTPWYLATAAKGPLVALLIMLFITNVSADISGIQINLGQARIEILIFLAGILGFYSRVAVKQLDLLVARVFPAAWQAAQDDRVEIRPTAPLIETGGELQFKVKPSVVVKWALAAGSPGSIAADGRYTAPKTIAGQSQQAIIRATTEEGVVLAEALATIVAPQVAGPAGSVIANPAAGNGHGIPVQPTIVTSSATQGAAPGLTPSLATSETLGNTTNSNLNAAPAESSTESVAAARPDLPAEPAATHDTPPPEPPPASAPPLAPAL